MSLVGPRPTEPERVNLSDPAWQRTLSVRPGLVSLAIIRMARTYNQREPHQKLESELEHVERQSWAFDAKVLLRFVQGYLSSGGNTKMRGEPRRDI